ncbi:MAG: ATP-dependent Clp protease proteolytic subunit [Tannerellaceae bacterium]|jgi:ATP-dependent protease ClpP protease subunit|nr:ATP-dependent Clp protease proteolytic subunit [Tannerellaceae bacterium]
MSKKKYNIDLDSYIGSWLCSKKYVKQILNDAGESQFVCRVNTLGGNLDDAIDIAAQFEAHGNVTCELFSFVASSGTVLTLGAKTVRAHVNSAYLIHKALTWIDTWGYMNEDDIDAAIEELKMQKNNAATITLTIARMFAKKSGKQVKDILNLMKEEKWLSASEAKEWGFVDEVFSESDTTPAPVDEDMIRLINAAGLPPVPERPAQDEKTVPDDSRNILTAIRDSINSLANSFTNNKITSEMKKDYSFVNTLLSVEGIEFKNGKAELTEAQLKLLNDALDTANKDKEAAESKLAEKDTEITNLKNTNTDLQSQVDTLNSAAGADTTQVNKETDEAGSGESSDDSAYVATARKLFNILPD